MSDYTKSDGKLNTFLMTRDLMIEMIGQAATREYIGEKYGIDIGGDRDLVGLHSRP